MIYAIENNNTIMVKYLLEKGVDIIKCSSQVVFDVSPSVSNYSMEMINLLIENGVNINVIPKVYHPYLFRKYDKKPETIPDFKKTNTCPISDIELNNNIEQLGCSVCLNVFEKKSLEKWFKISKILCPMCRTGETFYLV